MNEVYISRAKRNLGHPQSARLIRKAVEKVLEAEDIPELCIVSVLLCDDEDIRAANKQFRNCDSVTDVLSFPFNDLVPGSFCSEGCDCEIETGAILLGDIMLNLKRSIDI